MKVGKDNDVCEQKVVYSVPPLSPIRAPTMNEIQHTIVIRKTRSCKFDLQTKFLGTYLPYNTLNALKFKKSINLTNTLI